ncbi:MULTISPECIES: ATP phosphoribosyltransferase [Kocuria]|uniref:ATP phosphoribosyltransferase n=2 Tax=Kocuria marina TaxID=223184 RepID=A0A1X7E5X5_9MICC|nr:MULTISPECIES: ATP phosphoribosyltransferase [Kocuria]KHE75037.1 ATP phosphoribosyltransferase [Kocuria marina]MCT1616077.1 ATP phosphoribosyltransferase [Kocuria marina]MCT1722480.1 ATP phosphoribosyltransferase [Kocuria marina]MCT1734685.1 ATP phosphoribosyltransferase [Kocuria marina]MCT2021384.1 ATP phosphoribosyltransferase [Kocuria marina]
MLRVAVPNKGALSEAAITMLTEAGYRQRRSTRELVLVDNDNHVEFFYLRPRDIAIYVGGGTLDLGITGRDLLLDSGAEAEEELGLDFARSTFRLAGPRGQFESVQELEGKRIATSYQLLLERYLADRGVDAEVVRLDGAVESSIRLGVADAIADVVETGNTLRAAGLEIFDEPIMTSEALLIRRGDEPEPEGLRVLRRRLQGVLVARQYVMMDYDITEDLLAAATEITPGMQGPTISPLGHDGAVAVRAMVRKSDTNKVMDALYEVGARAILVSPIQAARI